MEYNSEFTVHTVYILFVLKYRISLVSSELDSHASQTSIQETFSLISSDFWASKRWYVCVHDNWWCVDNVRLGLTLTLLSRPLGSARGAPVNDQPSDSRKMGLIKIYSQACLSKGRLYERGIALPTPAAGERRTSSLTRKCWNLL